MKLLSLLFITPLVLFISCASQQAAEMNTQSPMIAEEYEGLITTEYASQGCGLLIEYQIDSNNSVLVRPISIDEKFKKHGTEVIFTFRVSRAMNDGCDLANPVIIESMRLAKD